MHHLARTLVPVSTRHLLPRAPRRVLVVGGGPTGLFCADRLRHHFEVTVVDSKDYFEFTPGVLRAIGDPSHLSRITFDYREVLEKQLGVEFVSGEALHVDLVSPGHPNRGGALTVAEPGNARDRHQLFFDYCIVAVGVSNGFWKPRVPGVSMPIGADIPGSPPLSGVSVMGSDMNERSMESRRKSFRMLREHLSTASGVVVVGAGLVGVELAAELAHFFPRLSVTLVDGSPKVLPQLADGAREYARNFLLQHGVRLQLGTAFSPDLAKGQVVLWCVGTRSRNETLFSDQTGVLTSRGQIRVNKRMQVLHQVLQSSGEATSSSTASNPDGNGSAAAGASGAGAGSSGTPVEYEPLGQGRIFAVGDCAAVEGVPTAQMIFHGEEMAAVAVATIEAAEDIASPLAFGKTKREAEPGLPLLCNTSLGPLDGMFSTQSELLATGSLAAVQKQLIETTKMNALQGELLSSLAWLPVH